MPKKSKPESPEDQSERFKREAQKLIDAGELDPGKGEAVLDRIAKKSRDDPPSRPLPPLVR